MIFSLLNVPNWIVCFALLLKLFMSLKVPTVAAKTLGPTQVIDFMGIALDSVQMVACLPEDKLARIKTLLDSFKGRRCARLIEL